MSIGNTGKSKYVSSGNPIFRIFAYMVLIAAFMTISGCASNSVAKNSQSAGQNGKTADNAPLTVTCIDVGKGDCILIEKDGSHILVDAGYQDTSDKVTEYLQQAGVEYLDYFIITHYDKDHVGGAAAIAETFSIGKIYLPDYEGESKYYTAFLEAAATNSKATEEVSEDISFTLMDVEYTLFASEIEYVQEEGKEANDNDMSIVLTAYYGDDSYLFAGDLEKEGIKQYLAAGHGQFDVVKMPHHGKKESNTDDFIEDTQPKLAIITDSAEDTADNKVLKLLNKAGASVYQTSVCGTVVVTGTGTGEYEAKTERPL